MTKEFLRVKEENNKFFIEKYKPERVFLLFFILPESWTKVTTNYGTNGHDLWDFLSFDRVKDAENYINTKPQETVSYFEHI